MKRRKVVFTKVARDQLGAAKTWWVDNNRPGELLAGEIEQAITFLAWLPGAGALYRQVNVPGLRRLYLHRISSHVYYTFTQDVVTVRTFWHARRGHGPIFLS